MCTLYGHLDRVTSCSFSPDGASVLSSSRDNTLKIWDAATGARFRGSLSLHLIYWVERASCCARGPVAVSSLLKLRAGVRDQAAPSLTGEEKCTLFGHTDPVNACAFSPDGKVVLSAAGAGIANDNTLKLWDASTGALISRVECVLVPLAGFVSVQFLSSLCYLSELCA